MPRFGLSATQLVATALAAITATFLASYLGVSGTIIGAAVASVATAIGNAVYGHSIRTTRDRVREVVPVRHTRTDPASPTIVLPAVGSDEHEVQRDAQPVLPAADRRGELGSRRPVATPATTLRRVAFVAAGMFAAVLAVVTSVELLAGRPVTDLVRGDSGSGTTLFGVNPANRGPQPSAPTVTMTITPSVVFTTPTVTQTAPAVTKTATPTTTVPSSGRSGTPSSTGTPSAPAPTQSGSSSPRG